jgi:hypothetical protein
MWLPRPRPSRPPTLNPEVRSNFPNWRLTTTFRVTHRRRYPGLLQPDQDLHRRPNFRTGSSGTNLASIAVANPAVHGKCRTCCAEVVCSRALRLVSASVADPHQATPALNNQDQERFDGFRPRHVTSSKAIGSSTSASAVSLRRTPTRTSLDINGNPVDGSGPHPLTNPCCPCIRPFIYDPRTHRLSLRRSTRPTVSPYRAVRPPDLADLPRLRSPPDQRGQASHRTS